MYRRASLEHRHYVIVFDNLRFHPSIRIYMRNLGFQKSPPWKGYLRTSVFGGRKRQLRVDGSRIRREKNLRFRKYPAMCGCGKK